MEELGRKPNNQKLCKICMEAQIHREPSGSSTGACLRCRNATKAMSTYWRKIGMPIKKRKV